jgi:hypothetical protein
MGSALTTRGWTYGKQAVTAIVVSIVWATVWMFVESRGWHIWGWAIPWVLGWSKAWQAGVGSIFSFLLVVAVIWIFRPTEMRLEYYQQ